ncbi:MAG TPA: DegT/DnrJ/EryC1/StrS family aminotransferase [Candidatus Sulfotelmatobacter sp.]|nr:DegT/DnrJ/EryC1/StrS family aminotransferase [Candidatus Sulfotelmatobacter sp.]
MRTSVAPVQIPVTKPFLGEEEERAVVEVLRSGWVVQGPRVAEFERSVADYVGAAHAVATSSCTTALHLALRLLEIGPGHEVILPSFTFIATANAVRYVGAMPVFADIDPRSYNLDPDGVEAAVTPRTRAILAVHQIGLAADMDRIQSVAERHGLAVLEDAAPSLGATYRGRRVGGLENVTCFSFHPRKVITTGEGGMLTLQDAGLADRARRLRAHGMSVSDLARHRAGRVVIEDYPEVGYNYRMSDLHAAVGIEQMKRLPALLARRREQAERYNRAFADLPAVQLPLSLPSAPHTYQSYLLQLLPEARKSRDQVMAEMLEAGVATRPSVMAVHLTPPYRGSSRALPITERVSRNGILLPLYHTMTDAEHAYVIEQLRQVLGA